MRNKKYAHAPLPWKSDGYLRVFSNETAEDILGANRVLASAAPNIEFVVRACNAHYSLVDALQQCVEAAGKLQDGARSNAAVYADIRGAAFEAQKALEEAKPAAGFEERAHNIVHSNWESADDAVYAVRDLPKGFHKRTAMELIEHSLNIGDVRFAGEFMLKFFGARE